METISYVTGLAWYAMWPLVIVVAYKFTMMNVEHLEKNLEEKEVIEPEKIT